MSRLLETSTTLPNSVNRGTCFQNITNKNTCSFIKFDISEFLSSISEEFSEISVNFGKIRDRIIRIIKHARKLLLFGITGVWVKNNDNPLFYVTTGSFNGADGCELVVLHLLSKIVAVIDLDNVGLYRDDGVAVIHIANDPKRERPRKNIIATFKTKGSV